MSVSRDINAILKLGVRDLSIVSDVGAMTSCCDQQSRGEHCSLPVRLHHCRDAYSKETADKALHCLRKHTETAISRIISTVRHINMIAAFYLILSTY